MTSPYCANPVHDHNLAQGPRCEGADPYTGPNPYYLTPAELDHLANGGHGYDFQQDTTGRQYIRVRSDGPWAPVVIVSPVPHPTGPPRATSGANLFGACLAHVMSHDAGRDHQPLIVARYRSVFPGDGAHLYR